MIVQIFSLLALATFVAAYDPNACSGGIADGGTTERGRYWYQCRKGQLIPQGCLTESSQRINIGGTYDSNSYRLQCVQDRDGYLTIVFKGCIYNGREYQPLEEWDDVKYAYRCAREGDHLRVEVAGCIDQGRRVAIDQKVTRGSFVYQCRKTKNGTCSMCPIGCAKDGREYGIGDAFERGDFWYTCLRDPDNNRKIAIKPSGCVHNGRRLNDQEHFQRQDVVFQCVARDGDARAVVAGCVNGGREVPLGDTWSDGQAPYKYEMVCKAQENSAIKVQKRCFYDVSAGQYTVEPGCYRIVDRAAIGCLKDSSGRLEIRAFQLQNIEQVGSLGLHLC